MRAPATNHDLPTSVTAKSVVSDVDIGSALRAKRFHVRRFRRRFAQIIGLSRVKRIDTFVSHLRAGC